MTWQKVVRLIIAVGAVTFAIVVGFAFKRRVPAAPTSVPASDPGAVVDSADGTDFRLSGAHKDLSVKWKTLRTYADGSTKMFDVTVVTERAGGKRFTMTGNEGEVGKNESEFSLTGNVHIAVSDGMLIHTEHATYQDSDGIIRAPGAVDIARGRMTGTSNGLVYDKKVDQLTLLDRVSVHLAPDAGGTGTMNISAPSAVFNRVDKTIHFERGLNAVRGPQTISAAAAVAHLSEDEERLQAIELRGNSKIGGTQGGVGGLRALTGRDVDLRYGPDGQAIEHALVVGNAVIQLAGEPRQAGRRVSGNSVDLSLAPDGSTPTGLTARDNVQLFFPAEAEHGTRTINSQALDCAGDADQGLTRAHFEGAVQYHEQSPTVDRRAKSQALDASLGPGMSSLDEAKFARAVQFNDGSMTATAAAATYLLDAGKLDLTGSTGTAMPRVDTDQIGVDAPQIAVTLTGPLVHASGSVKSVMKHPKNDAEAKSNGTKVPSMLKSDEDVMVTSSDLNYDGTQSKATYTGQARLSQGDTSIKGNTIIVDDKSGDLAARGTDKENVATAIVREEPGKDNTVERVRSDAKAQDFKYEDETRRLTYTGDAHMVGSDGEMTAAKIELYLTPAGDEAERVEAYDKVTLREPGRRTTTGSRLTYTSANEQYVVSGTPVEVLYVCGRDHTGKTLTLFKASDRIVVDGDDVTRTQTTGGTSNCP